MILRGIQRVWPCLGVGLLLLLPVPGAQAQASVDQKAGIARGEQIVPADSWVYTAMIALVRDGISGDSDGMDPSPWEKRPASRFEAAVWTGRALMRVERLLAMYRRGELAPRYSPVRYTDWDVALLKKLVREFTGELNLLGVGADYTGRVLHALEQIVGAHSASAPFPDVPRGHSAYTAVERLRREGILVGPPPPASPSRAKSR